MSAIAQRTATRPVITRRFESSRHQRINLVAAFEHALPIIQRRRDPVPTPGHSAAAPCRQRRAIS
jgi:hypothetical protein